MKDVAHHLAHIQRKIVQSARKELKNRTNNHPHTENNFALPKLAKSRTLRTG